MSVKLVEDTVELRRFLQKKPYQNAYLLGDLDPHFSPFCKWYGFYGDDGEITALALLYNGLRVPVLITSGDDDCIQHLLHGIVLQLPRQLYCHISPTHRHGLSLYFDWGELKSTLRMGIDSASRQNPADTSAVVALSHSDTAGILQLYAHYPDNFFEPYQLESGYYFGVREGDQIVSIAGVHVVSEIDDIAAIGNVVTHPDHRRKGYSRACTTRLLQALFPTVSRVALNVREANTNAIQAFSRLGFQKQAVFLEGMIERHC